MSKPITIIVETSTGKKKLFKLRELSNGDVSLISYYGKIYRALNDPPVGRKASELDGKTVTEKRYSIHRSQNSAEGVNTLKLTQMFADGEKINSYQVTKAIKSGKIAPLFCKRCSGMLDAEYTANEGVSLGKFDESQFTLFYTVLVTAPNTEFSISPNDEFNVQRFEFSHFSLLVLWSYIHLPSHKTSAIAEYMTINPAEVPESVRKILEQSMNGNSPDESKNLYLAVRLRLLDEMVSCVATMEGLNPAYLEQFRAFGFFKTGRTKTPEFLRKMIGAFSQGPTTSFSLLQD